MSDEKRKDFGIKGKGPGPEKEDPQRSDTASRARNRTVLLTPEVAGQVRALLNKEEDKSVDPLSDILPPVSWENQPGSIDRPTTAWNSEALASEAEKGGFASRKSSGLGQPRPPERPSAPLGSPNASPAVSGRPAGGSGSFNPTQHVMAPPAPASSSFGSGSYQHNPPPPQPVAVQPAAAHPAPASARNRKSTGTFQVSPQSKLVGFLVSYDGSEHGEVIEIRIGRWLLTSRPSEHGDHILVDDESISPLHAIVRASKEGKVQVLDQLSEFGTGVTPAASDKEEEVTGSMATLSHGDLVRFGKRKFIVCLVPVRDDALPPAEEK